MLKRIFNFNSAWAILFTLLQVLKFWYLTKDGHVNIPVTLQQYKEIGGSTFNYYAGYLFFATYTDWLHYACVLLYLTVWIYGYAAISHIDRYRDQQNMIKPIPSEEILSKPVWYHYLAGAVTTAITLYGMIYTVLYVILYVTYDWFK